MTPSDHYGISLTVTLPSISERIMIPPSASPISTGYAKHDESKQVKSPAFKSNGNASQQIGSSSVLRDSSQSGDDRANRRALQLQALKRRQLLVAEDTVEEDHTAESVGFPVHKKARCDVIDLT